MLRNIRLSLFVLVWVSGQVFGVCPTVEVLHWWTSGGEASALRALKTEYEKSGGCWQDVPIAGGGGDTALTVLKSRFASGNSPAVAQMHMGFQVWEWGKVGALADVNALAAEEKWDLQLPKIVADMVKYEGKYVALPVNIHRSNSMWVNASTLKKVNAKAPTTWAEFNSVAEKLQRKGITPLAHGGQPWQDAILFDSVVLGIGGPDFYRKALVDADPASLGGPIMVQVFDQMRKLKGFTDAGSPGRDWNQTTGLVARGEAAMQIMGDWVKSELTAAGKLPDRDYLCLPAPGTQGDFSIINDSLALFKKPDPAHVSGQNLIAKIVMGENFQRQFSLLKGSIPARLDVKRDKFDACARRSMDDLAASARNGKAVASFTSGGVSPAMAGAITDVVTNHFNSSQSSTDAAKSLAQTVVASKL